jgi:hypothetical protein
LAFKTISEWFQDGFVEEVAKIFTLAHRAGEARGRKTPHGRMK